MGLLGKIGGVFKAVGGAVFKVARSVFTGKVTGLATTALSFIPGFNAAGIMGKALSFLGGSGRIRNFFQNGLQVFGGLVSKFGLSSIVERLPVPQHPPLPDIFSQILDQILPPGVKDVVRKVRNFFRDVWGGVPMVRDILNHAKGLIGRARDLVDYADQRLPGDWSDITSALTDAEGTVGKWVEGVNWVDKRLESIVEMLNEVLSIVEAQPQPQPLPEGSIVLR